ncbi:6-phosphogluconolactonase [Microbacterium sp. zg.B48]|uniref:6-phosphogluconolactonase n=1 Tax=Microbacterium sp. zg.B48 TaxID=2969408 RepID=UPI00214ADD8E|nr:6-phosphogluconolactonase [Microbacterium sp. zg.B48]MCR2762153.1 6-phosphogluconolactonase [Microbacterium sp. zg.B48]
MAEFGTEKRVVISPDPATLAESVAERLIHRLAKRAAHSRPVHVSLTGGSMGSAVLMAAMRHPRRSRVDWSGVHFWWSDERFLARDDAERNERQARAALLDSLEIPAGNIHAVAASDDGVELDEAADRYAAELARYPQKDGTPWPSFDICFLGVGPDGHIASLFPDRPEILITDRVTVAVRDSPKPPPDRVSLTRPVINGSKRVWLVLSGADKASALGLALAGASYSSVPVAGAKGRKRTVFFVDQAAASQVPPELIDREY